MRHVEGCITLVQVILTTPNTNITAPPQYVGHSRPAPAYTAPTRRCQTRPAYIGTTLLNRHWSITKPGPYPGLSSSTEFPQTFMDLPGSGSYFHESHEHSTGGDWIDRADIWRLLYLPVR